MDALLHLNAYFLLHFFASPYPAVTANRSGPWQNLIDVVNLDCKVTKRERSHQNVEGREETYKRPWQTVGLNVVRRRVSGVQQLVSAHGL